MVVGEGAEVVAVGVGRCGGRSGQREGGRKVCGKDRYRYRAG